MKMLRYIYYVPFLAATLFVMGCDLEEKILDTPVASNYINDRSDVEPVLRGIYAAAFDPSHRVHLGYLVWPLEDGLWGNNANIQGVSFKSVAYNSGFNSVGIVWRNWYWGIVYANNLMRDVANADLDSDYRDEVIGECLFMRAYLHFCLTRTYGEVPLRNEPVDGASEMNLPPASYEEIYTQIFEDLKAAEALLPAYSERSAAVRFHANKGAAQGILAEAALTYASISGNPEHYRLAIEYCDKVINSGEYVLMPDFGDLWDISKELDSYDEVIFRCVNVGDDQSHGVGYPTWFNPNNLLGTSWDGRSGNEWLKVQPWFYDIYNKDEYVGDYRVEKSFHTRYQHQATGRECFTYPLLPTTADYVAPRTAPYIAKYQDPNGYSFWGHGTDLYLLRMGEIYLIKAEAENELNGGPTTAAYDAFNAVRERARKADGNLRTTPENLAEGLTQEEFRMKVFHERGLELLAEGKRWYDLKRMKYTDGRTMYEYMFEDYIPSLPQGLPVWNRPNNRWDGGVNFPQSTFMDAQGNSLDIDVKKYLLVPIPAAEISVNTHMKQNYGW